MRNEATGIVKESARIPLLQRIIVIGMAIWVFVQALQFSYYIGLFHGKSLWVDGTAEILAIAYAVALPAIIFVYLAPRWILEDRRKSKLFRVLLIGSVILSITIGVYYGSDSSRYYNGLHWYWFELLRHWYY